MTLETIDTISNIKCERERLMKFLFIRVSSVLAKTKASVLVRYTNSSSINTHNKYKLFINNQKFICETLGLDFIELKKTNNELQILFFDRALLFSTLAEPVVKNFLKNCGYENNLSLNEKLNILKCRFTSERFPHEIGIFLGYPLKDVKGFTEGRTDFAKIPKTMWKIFDSVDESLNRMDLFRRIEAVAASVAKQYKTTSKCIEKFKLFTGVITRTA